MTYIGEIFVKPWKIFEKFSKYEFFSFSEIFEPLLLKCKLKACVCGQAATNRGVGERPNLGDNCPLAPCWLRPCILTTLVVILNR